MLTRCFYLNFFFEEFVLIKGSEISVQPSHYIWISLYSTVWWPTSTKFVKIKGFVIYTYRSLTCFWELFFPIKMPLTRSISQKSTLSLYIRESSQYSKWMGLVNVLILLASLAMIFYGVILRWGFQNLNGIL